MAEMGPLKFDPVRITNMNGGCRKPHGHSSWLAAFPLRTGANAFVLKQQMPKHIIARSIASCARQNGSLVEVCGSAT